MNHEERQQLDRWIINGDSQPDPRPRKTGKWTGTLKPVETPNYLQMIILDRMPRQGEIKRLPATDQEFEKRCGEARIYAGRDISERKWENATQAVYAHLQAMNTRIAQMHALNIRKYYLQARRDGDIRKVNIIADEAWNILTKSYDKYDLRLKRKAFSIFIHTAGY